MSLKYGKDIQFKKRLRKNVENQQGEQGERRTMSCKMLLEAFQTARQCMKTTGTGLEVVQINLAKK